MRSMHKSCLVTDSHSSNASIHQAWFNGHQVQSTSFIFVRVGSIFDTAELNTEEEALFQKDYASLTQQSPTFPTTSTLATTAYFQSFWSHKLHPRTASYKQHQPSCFNLGWRSHPERNQRLRSYGSQHFRFEALHHRRSLGRIVSGRMSKHGAHLNLPKLRLQVQNDSGEHQ